MSLEENGPGGNAGSVPRIEKLAPPMPEVSVWWCSLEPSRTALRTYERTLSEAERMRAGRFGSALLRERYIMGRGTLRKILGGELRASPESVEIVRGERGRPQLAQSASLDFNLSHTASIAIVGVARGARIGVDVERADRAINVSGIAAKFLTERERAAAQTLDAEDARRRVLALWTCKEAMSKATGDALAAPFSRIDVALDNGMMLSEGPGKYEPSRWTLLAAGAPPEYIATIALWRPA